jgi:hypothetical protein
VEGAVEVLVGGDAARTKVAEATSALTELRVHAHRQHKGHQRRQDQDNVPPPSHEASLPSKWKSGNVENVVSGFSRTQTNQSPYLRGPILAGPVDVGTSQSHRL